MSEFEFVFQDGCMWEGGEWKIVTEYECSSFGGGKPCKHCYSERDKQKPDSSGGFYTEHIWLCPKIIIAKNEGGYNSVGICLDCILEAAKLLYLKEED